MIVAESVVTGGANDCCVVAAAHGMAVGGVTIDTRDGDDGDCDDGDGVSGEGGGIVGGCCGGGGGTGGGTGLVDDTAGCVDTPAVAMVVAVVPSATGLAACWLAALVVATVVAIVGMAVASWLSVAGERAGRERH